MDCPKCDKFNSQLDTHCSRCGTPLDDEDEREEEEEGEEEESEPAPPRKLKKRREREGREVAQAVGGIAFGTLAMIGVGMGVVAMGISHYPMQTIAGCAVAGLIIYLWRGK